MVAHSELGASGAYRWINCKGSWRMQKGRPNTSTLAAQKGTAEHAVAEMCLKSGQDAVEYIDRLVEEIMIDEPAADRVQEFVDHCRSVSEMADQTWIEARFNLERFNPPVPMFGTVDFGSYIRTGKHSGILEIDDYKSGFIPVDANQNPQLKYYALGAMLVLDAAGLPVTSVRAAIVQPRRKNTSCEYEATELLAWSLELMEAAHATQAPDAPLNPGSWCGFCLAAGDCRARADHLLKIAQTQFHGVPVRPDSDVTWDDVFGRPVDTVDPLGLTLDDLTLESNLPALPAPPGHRAPPNPEGLSGEQLAEILHRAPEFTSWLKACAEEAQRRHWQGADQAPGWKVVEEDTGRPAWITATGDLALVAMSEWSVDPYAERKILSPAQMRGRLAAVLPGKTKKARETAARAALREHLSRPARGYALVPESDPRAAVTSGQEFPLITEEPE